LSLTKVGIVIGIVVSNASAAENADWFGQRLFDAVAKDTRLPSLRSAGSGGFAATTTNSAGAIRCQNASDERSPVSKRFVSGQTWLCAGVGDFELHDVPNRAGHVLYGAQ